MRQICEISRISDKRVDVGSFQIKLYTKLNSRLLHPHTKHMSRIYGFDCKPNAYNLQYGIDILPMVHHTGYVRVGFMGPVVNLMLSIYNGVLTLVV